VGEQKEKPRFGLMVEPSFVVGTIAVVQILDNEAGGIEGKTRESAFIWCNLAVLEFFEK
jgi:hypothetical protein